MGNTPSELQSESEEDDDEEEEGNPSLTGREGEREVEEEEGDVGGEELSTHSGPNHYGASIDSIHSLQESGWIEPGTTFGLGQESRVPLKGVVEGGLVLEQEPEGSPFRRQPSQAPLEPQQHAPQPPLALDGGPVPLISHGSKAQGPSSPADPSPSEPGPSSLFEVFRPLHQPEPVPPLRQTAGQQPDLPPLVPLPNSGAPQSLNCRGPPCGQLGRELRQGFGGDVASSSSSNDSKPLQGLEGTEGSAGGAPRGVPPGCDDSPSTASTRERGGIGAVQEAKEQDQALRTPRRSMSSEGALDTGVAGTSPRPGSGVEEYGTGPGSSGGIRSRNYVLRQGTNSPLGGLRFGSLATDLLLAASASLSSHPFLHRPLMLPQDLVTEFYIIRHGEASHNVSSLIGGRSVDAPLTSMGEQQAKLLGKFLRQYTDLHFDAIYSSPIERSLRTAHIVCQEMGVPQEEVHLADALQELSQGKWEQQPRKSIYKEGVLERMTAAQPDFRAPGGESQRQVEYRMVEFVNSVLFSRLHMALGDDFPWVPALSADEVLGDDVDAEGAVGGGTSEPRALTIGGPAMGSVRVESVQSRGNMGRRERKANHEQADDGELAEPSEVLGTGLCLSNGEGSRLRANQRVNGLDDAQWEGTVVGETPSVGAQLEGKSVFRVALFSHGTAIRCLLRGVMSWDPHLTHKVAIDNTSVTLFKHTVTRGWHLVKLNDTAHLILARGPVNPH